MSLAVIDTDPYIAKITVLQSNGTIGGKGYFDIYFTKTGIRCYSHEAKKALWEK